MARQAQPWRRNGESGDWHAWVKGKCVWLAPTTATKTEARDVLAKILAEPTAPRQPRGGLSTRDIINLFLAHCEAAAGRGELERVTVEGYSRHLVPAREALGRHRAHDAAAIVAQPALPEGQLGSQELDPLPGPRHQAAAPQGKVAGLSIGIPRINGAKAVCQGHRRCGGGRWYGTQARPRSR